MCVVVVVVVFAQKKNFKRIGHKSVQNGAHPYEQFFSQNILRTKTTKLGVDENRAQHTSQRHLSVLKTDSNLASVHRRE